MRLSANRAIVIGLALLVFLGILAGNASGLPSERATIVEFFVKASNSLGDAINVSHKGGTIRIGNEALEVVPYKSYYWKDLDMWLIFMASAEDDNFHIIFLYILPRSNEVYIRHYEYAEAKLSLVRFRGTFGILDKTVELDQRPWRSLSLKAQPKLTSPLFVIGPTVYIDGRQGYLIDGEATLGIYSIYQQLDVFSGNQNELWVLLEEPPGAYYFGIIFMLKDAPDSVVLGHVVRLNDYSPSPNLTLKARWFKGPDTSLLTITTGTPGLTVWVDGFPFKSSAEGVLRLRLPKDRFTLKVPELVSVTVSARLLFKEWSDGIKEASRVIRLEKNEALSVIYKRQYFVNVTSIVGDPTGTGWYDEGSKAEISVTPIVEFGNGTRAVFVRWAGDVQEDRPKIAVTVYGPLRIWAEWKAQYYLALRSQYGAVEGEGWYDGGSVATIRALKVVDLDDKTRAVFDGWKGDYEGLEDVASVVMTGPKSIVAVWVKQYMVSVKIDGVPKAFSISLNINGTKVAISSSEGYSVWVNDSAKLVFSIDSMEIVSEGAKYRFFAWVDELGNRVSFPLTVNRPMELTAVFMHEPAQAITTNTTVITSTTSAATFGNGTTTPAWPKRGRSICAIATAYSGTMFNQAIDYLRSFRDKHAYSTFAGRSFLEGFYKMYYMVSPGVASFLDSNPMLLRLAFIALLPLVFILQASVELYWALPFKGEAAMTLIGLVISILAGATYSVLAYPLIKPLAPSLSRARAVKALASFSSLSRYIALCITVFAFGLAFQSPSIVATSSLSLVLATFILGSKAAYRMLPLLARLAAPPKAPALWAWARGLKRLASLRTQFN